MADAYATSVTFAEYNAKKTANTLRRHRDGLNSFAQFICDRGVEDCPEGEELQTEPAAWAEITHGLVKAYQLDLLNNGYAVSTTNFRLSTVKTYAKLAYNAGTLNADNYTKIANITGYSQSDRVNLDQKRETTRIGHKAETAIILTDTQAQQLKEHQDTPQGRRDAVLMCLLLEHGLRCGEIAGLEVRHFDVEAGTMTFYRPKVKKEQTHELSPDTLRAVKAWIDSGDCTPFGPLLRGSRKGGKLTDAGMSERAITKRVKSLADELEVAGLSAHDCRHTWATNMARTYSIDRLMHAGGWSSHAMPLRYIEAAKVANKGMRTSY